MFGLLQWQPNARPNVYLVKETSDKVHLVEHLIAGFECLFLLTEFRKTQLLKSNNSNMMEQEITMFSLRFQFCFFSERLRNNRTPHKKIN